MTQLHRRPGGVERPEVIGATLDGAVAGRVLDQRQVRVLDRRSVLVDLLAHEERVDRMARHQHLDGVSRAAADGADVDLGDAVVRVDAQQLVAVVADREARGPAQALGARLQDPGIDAEFDPPVPHGAHVSRDEVREIRTGGDGHGEDQIAGVLGVPVEGAADPFAEQRVVHADVIRLRAFPMDVRVHRARPDGGDELPAEVILGQAVAVGVGRVLQIVPERLVAGLGPRRPDLQVRDRRDTPQERLLRDPPGQRHRGERAPLMPGPEAR